MTPPAFTHEAMSTTFEFRARHAEPAYARQAAQAAFAEIDRLETLLSRFHEGGDIWRVNHAAAGERVAISEECHACLMQSLRLHGLTGGAFDITIGGAADLVKNAEKNRAAPAPGALQALLAQHAAGTIALSPGSFAVEVVQTGASLDLGAIGKGFALDAARALFREWEIENALLSAGGSSVLAIGSNAGNEATTDKSQAPENEPAAETPAAAHAAAAAAPATRAHSSFFILHSSLGGPAAPPGWPVNIRGETRSATLVLRDCALGASGTGGQGRHIIDPRRRSQTYAHIRAWALAPDAAEADGLSTAWMTMDRDEIAGVLTGLAPGRAAIVENPDGSLHLCNQTGAWTLLESAGPPPPPPSTKTPPHPQKKSQKDPP
ncbi:MAG: FAD:protein FMN transferase, partial [Opitutaceae bacterium]|nr:FAD:protein FMN transferase [Opitutaceae bacterium]